MKKKIKDMTYQEYINLCRLNSKHCGRCQLADVCIKQQLLGYIYDYKLEQIITIDEEMK